jgi:hypothetical protein
MDTDMESTGFSPMKKINEITGMDDRLVYQLIILLVFIIVTFSIFTDGGCSKIASNTEEESFPQSHLLGTGSL